jgi:hypothetical protein
MPGPAPKDPSLRERRNKKASAAKLKIKPVVKDEAGNVPLLPKRRRKWMPETLAWWNSVWTSPMAREGKYIDADLPRLFMLADLIDRFWRASAGGYWVSKKNAKGKVVKKLVVENVIALAVEIRLQGACFGLTPLDRSRLQWQMVKGDEADDKRKRRDNDRYTTKPHQVDPRTIKTAVN